METRELKNKLSKLKNQSSDASRLLEDKRFQLKLAAEKRDSILQKRKGIMNSKRETIETLKFEAQNLATELQAKQMEFEAVSKLIRRGMFSSDKSARLANI